MSGSTALTGWSLIHDERYVMSYAFDFSGFGLYAGMLARGTAVTLGLTAVSTVLGGLVGIGGASVAVAGPR
jgi:polar amino acid transport system permease protein